MYDSRYAETNVIFNYKGSEKNIVMAPIYRYEFITT